MIKTKSGFTIVELLIVIVVIAILAAISIVAYNGIQQRAKNSQTVNAASAYIKGINLMLGEAQVYPTVSSSYLCLGQSSCRGGSWANSTTLDTELRKYMGQTLPQPNTSAVTDNSSTGYVSIGFVSASANVTLDGSARNWLIYSLSGVTTCPVGPVVSGSWPTFSSTAPANGRTTANGDATGCYVALPNS